MPDLHKRGKPTNAADPRELVRAGKRSEPGPAPSRGRDWSPKSRTRLCILLVHAQGSGLASLLLEKEKESLPVTSTFYYPENMPQGDGASDKGMPEWGRRGAPGVNKEEKWVPFTLCRSGLRSLPLSWCRPGAGGLAVLLDS